MGIDMNPHSTRLISPLALLRSMVIHHSLIFSLIKREVIGRYRGSVLGLFWSFLNPVLMLVVYTFVFSVVFKVRWSGGANSKTEFAMVLFAGLISFNLFSECINRAPTLILNNTNYVKKVVFPLEIFPLVAFGSAIFHLFISLLVWLLFHLIFFGMPPATIIFLPVTMLPLFLLTLGLSWFLASLSVYLRDVVQITGVITTVIMYLTPIFYSISALPAKYQEWMRINPLTSVMEQVRNVMIWGVGVDWVNLASQSCIAAVIAWLGFAWFQKTRKGFADVL
jgi:lipopolysaccharide transport system permease protein